MGTPAAHANWTVEMLDALPEDGQRYEIIDVPALFEDALLGANGFSPGPPPMQGSQRF
jgi:hypothetical protein